LEYVLKQRCVPTYTHSRVGEGCSVTKFTWC